MNIQDFICAELGLCTLDAKFIDGFEEDWEIDTDSIDYKELIRISVENDGVLCNLILNDYIYQLINRAVEEYGVNEDDFDYFINSMDTHVYYKKEEYYTWEDLKEKLENELKEKEEEE